MIIFVDDMLICCKNEENLIEIKKLRISKFRIKDLGKVQTYLGIDIKYDEKNNTMTLSQSKYIESLARKYEIENAKLYTTPMEQNLKCTSAEPRNDNILYRNLIGALLYVSSGTRPDVSFSVNYMSRFQNCCDSTHFKYALRILKYLYKTRDLKLHYEKKQNADLLDCFVDADWAGDVQDRKSTTGDIIKMYGNLIEWKSKKQGSVTKSSTSAEYVALSECVTEVLLLKNLLKDFDLKLQESIKIFEDNIGAVDISHLGNFTKRSRFIEVQFHFVNENYLEGVIDILKIDSNENVADILTKSLGRQKFEYFRNKMKLL